MLPIDFMTEVYHRFGGGAELITKLSDDNYQLGEFFFTVSIGISIMFTFCNFNFTY